MSNVEIVCVIDRSGSMLSIAQDAIGGFNNFLRNQKALSGEANLTLVLFDNEYQVAVDRGDLQLVKELDCGTFKPRGSTALYDAIGKAINEIGAKLDSDETKPDKVIFVILTDGEENSSKEFTQEKIAEMIQHQQDKYSWEFIFLAANQDAFAAGHALNIRAHNTANFAATAKGINDAYTDINNLTTGYRTKQ